MNDCIANMPDSTISIQDMHEYGYTWDGMLPIRKDVAEELFHKDIAVFRLYQDNTEATIDSLDEIKEFSDRGRIFGVERDEWEGYLKYESMRKDTENSLANKEAKLLFGNKDMLGIYQLKRYNENVRRIKFMGMDFLKKIDVKVDKKNYDFIYGSALEKDTTLDEIYERFNIDHPENFKGHSLSVSDIIVLRKDGEVRCYYVDSFGFTELSGFLQEEK